MHDIIRTENPHPIKVFFTTGSYLTQRAYANRVIDEILPKLDLIVVVDIFGTPTAKYADILGGEIIDGHPSEKHEVILREFGEVVRIFQWRAIDIDFVIKRASVDVTRSVEFSNIRESAPDNLFDAPSGYS